MDYQRVTGGRREPAPPAWLDAVVTSNKLDKFPYHYAVTKSKQTRFSPSIYPNEQIENPPELNVKKINGPVYLLNIPFCASTAIKIKKSTKQINELLTMVSTQSFHKVDGMEASSEIAKKRVFVILGINRPYSIDSHQNSEFASWMEDFPKCTIIKAFVVGRFWHPKMCEPGTLKALGLKKDADLEKRAVQAFALLKAKDAEKASEVQQYIKSQKFVKTKTKNNKKITKETKETRLHAQIPYQQIRDWLIGETREQSWLNKLMKSKEAPLVYLGCMDGDTLSLQGSESGLMQHYDDVIASMVKPPMLMSTGYIFPKETDALSCLSNDIDMKMRTEIAKFFPLGIYYPEPNFFLLLSELWTTKKIEQLSFVGGPGSDTESRRCIENLEKFWDVTRLYFAAKDCLVTSQPPRMIAKPIYAKSVLSGKRGDFSKGFDVKDLSEDFFNSLRGVSQTHLKGKVWASNLYIGLLMSNVMERVGKIADIHGPLMRIYNVFDFPTFFNDVTLLSDDKIKDFTFYEDYLLQLLVQFQDEETLIDLPNEIDEDYFSKQWDKLKAELGNLKKLNISEDDQIKILQAAAASGKSVYNTLSAHVSNFPKSR